MCYNISSVYIVTYHIKSDKETKRPHYQENFDLVDQALLFVRG